MPAARESEFGQTRLTRSSLPATMSSNLRLVPANNGAKATMKDTAATNGLHDTMRFGLRSLAAEANGRNPLQSRLENVRCSFFDPIDRFLYHLVGGDTRQSEVELPTQYLWPASACSPAYGAPACS